MFVQVRVVNCVVVMSKCESKSKIYSLKRPNLFTLLLSCICVIGSSLAWMVALLRGPNHYSYPNFMPAHICIAAGAGFEVRLARQSLQCQLSRKSFSHFSETGCPWLGNESFEPQYLGVPCWKFTHVMTKYFTSKHIKFHQGASYEKEELPKLTRRQWNMIQRLDILCEASSTSKIYL
jgi:hypothetical protein